jgi:ubiquinol-cytochrome c reductase iron-sulfur subunit
MSGKERLVAAGFAASIVGAALFVVAYATGNSRLLEGLSLAFAAACLSAALTGWFAWILPDDQVVDEYETWSESSRHAQDVNLHVGTREIARSGVLLRLFAVACGCFGVAALVPLRSLGPELGTSLFSTKWRRGSRVVRADGTLVRKDDLNVNSFETVFPEGAAGDARSQTMLIRLPEDADGSAAGYIAYSKVCTHAGCPVALYRAQARQLLCPCHQSVFDVADNGRVVSGPADHALPRLPIEIAPGGYLRARGDFPEPIGPGFWERA